MLRRGHGGGDGLHAGRAGLTHINRTLRLL
jgi:hypothetical protein